MAVTLPFEVLTSFPNLPSRTLASFFIALQHMNCDQSPTHPRNVLYDLAIPSRHPSALNADVALKGGPSCQASVLDIFISAFDKTVQFFQAVMVKLRPELMRLRSGTTALPLFQVTS